MADEDDDEKLEALDTEADETPASESDVAPDEDIETLPSSKEDKVEARPDTEEDLEPEYDASEELGKEADENMPKAAPKAAAPGPILVGPESQLDRYQNFINQYRQLQAQRQKADLGAGLLAAGDQISQAIAGRYSGQFKPDLTGVQMLQQQANQPVQDMELQQAVMGKGMQLQSTQQANDPTSPQSKLVRDYLNKRLGMNLPDNVSASDAMILMKTMGRPQQERALQVPLTNQQTGEKATGVWHPIQQMFTDLNGTPLGSDWIRDYRAQSFIDPFSHERMGFNAGTGKISGALTGPGVNRAGAVSAPGGQPTEINRTMLTAAQGTQLDHTRNEFLKEVKDDRNNLLSTDRVIAALQAGQELGDLPREDQDQLNRAFGQKGHISDQQVNTLLGRADWKDRFENYVNLGMNGKLTDENRQFLLNTLKVIRDQNQKFIDTKSQVYSNNMYNDLKSSPNLNKVNFNQDSVRNLLGVQSAGGATGQPQKTVVKKGYNPTLDKTQLIYSDGSKEIVNGRQ